MKINQIGRFATAFSTLLVLIFVSVFFSLEASIASDFSLWSGSTVPAVVDAGPDSPVELGVKFRSDSDGYITGIRFYKANTNTGTHVANLWTNTGTLLATATFTNETFSGWQQADFASPVPITANTIYVASYHCPAGHYSDDLNYFAGTGVDNLPLHALADGVSGFNGVYAYGSTSNFPNGGWNSSNYWVDVLLSTTAPPQATGPEPAGWYAGDMHVHRSCGGSPEAVSSIFDKMSPQNLAVISLLADMGNGEVQDPVQDLPRVIGQDDPVSTSGRILHWDAEWHWDPVYTQYPHQALGGHVVALGVTEAHQMWEEYTFPIFNWAHQAGGVAGFAHMQYLGDGIPQSLNCCIPLEYPVEVALGSADFVSEDVLGNDYAMQAYYRLLNCGFRPGLAAGTDYPCNGGADLGSLLTYVQVAEGQMTYRNWIDGIAKGRTVVSRNGHNEFLDLKVNGSATPGDEIKLTGAGSVSVSIQWTANQNLSGTIELVHNGVVVASQPASVGPDSPASLSATVDFAKSGWLAARRMGGTGHQVHTGAVFVTVNNAPVRASAADAEFYVQWMDNLLQKTSAGGAWSSYFVNSRDAAQERYKSAKAMYQQIALEAAGQPQAGYTIWLGTTIPGVVDAGPDDAVELGVKFRSDQNGYITGIRFYKAGANTGPHVANLWTSSGTLLATATFTNETASGWQQVNFSTPVAITANTVYVASYHCPAGHYSDDLNYFLGKGMDSPPLHALADGVSGFNGVYAYGFAGSFPNQGWKSSNYWVDVMFNPSAAPPTSHTIWLGTTVPAVADAGPDSPVELGVKFRSDSNGYITGIRFFKASGNTGTHVANLWSSSGTLLATATFTNETATGWQQANFATPIATTANTVYVASYHCPAGHYSDNQYYFSGKGMDSPPLHALADGVSGLNGVYAYGSSGSFPNEGWNSSNYWVDVVFSPIGP